MLSCVVHGGLPWMTFDRDRKTSMPCPPPRFHGTSSAPTGQPCDGAEGEAGDRVRTPERCSSGCSDHATLVCKDAPTGRPSALVSSCGCAAVNDIEYPRVTSTPCPPRVRVLFNLFPVPALTGKAANRAEGEARGSTRMCISDGRLRRVRDHRLVFRVAQARAGCLCTVAAKTAFFLVCVSFPPRSCPRVGTTFCAVYLCAPRRVDGAFSPRPCPGVCVAATTMACGEVQVSGETKSLTQRLKAFWG